jgi:predicted dehydrogenase
MKKVRFGVIGCGYIGKIHADGIAQAASREFCLSAVSDSQTRLADKFAADYHVPWFADYREMMDSGLVDAVIVAVPHYFHPTVTVNAARRGIHVLTEKPMAVTVGAARAMIRECARRKVALGVMFQMRFRSNMAAMKKMVDDGAIGEIFRVQMICSNWYRTQTYYNSGAWRGSWDGEGGGVLLNQAPHSLDLFQWIGGMPRRVLATLGTRIHKIEVENTANVILDYGQGRTGYIYATTAEAPGYEQFMVCGDKGTLVAEGDKLRFAKLKVPLTQHLTTCKEIWGSVPCQWKDVALRPTDQRHIRVTRNFVGHILRGEKLIAPGASGIGGLEISNAVYISGYKNKPVELPVDAAEMDRLLERLSRTRGAGRSLDLRRQANREFRRLLKN